MASLEQPLLVLLLALVAGVIDVHSASLLYRPEGDSVKVISSSRSIKQDHKSYTFIVGGNDEPYSYEDKYGKVVGFDVDLVAAVCKLVKKSCYTILTENKECIFTDRDMDYAGRGLMAQWFDGCSSYQITTDRQNEFDFTLPYLDATSTFMVAPGNPSGFNPSGMDYSTFTIMHLSGAPTNSQCLKRLRKKFGKVITVPDLSEARRFLLNATADVLFSTLTNISGLDILPHRVRCDKGGAGMLVKKGSSLPNWWNPAFQTFYFSGGYSQLCQEANEKYQGSLNCLPSPELASPELLSLLRAKTPKAPEKMWKFVVSGKIKPYSYLDDDGHLIGFTKDMLDTVCARAGKSCTLLLAQVSECSERQGELLYPGRGLMQGWFDACTGYFNTVDRSNSWDFTSPYLVSNATFKVAPGNPSGFDPKAEDFTKFTIVYTATAITNDHCLNRLGKKFNKVLIVKDDQDAISAILKGMADAWFTKMTGVNVLDTLDSAFHCEYVGTSIMVRKGSELPSWWNPAFAAFYKSGDFNDFCEEKERQYNVSFPCVPRPEPKRSRGDGDVQTGQVLQGY